MKRTPMPLRATLALTALCSLALAGSAFAQDNPEAAPETNCTDRVDNDGDGAIDCNDTDCGANDACKPAAAPPAPAAVRPTKEDNCSDRADNDGDTVIDCADADCFADPACRPSGQKEATNSLCSDFLDNDGDGAIDCEDHDCQKPNIAACQGSWRGGGAVATGTDPTLYMPELEDGMSVEDLVGKGSDKDGERNDELCSDGFDNDHDGRTDCADFGCRFDPNVTVCTGNPGMRFSIVAQVTQSHYFEKNPTSTMPDDDTRFSALQLRALGPIRGLQNSFFLISMRTEKTPRVSFAMFQVPISRSGHFLNINSGGGGLSAGLITSVSKNPLVEPPYYLYSAFEQGNGAAAEVGGPFDAKGKFHFRAFAAGGAGNFNGNVGGRYFSDDNTNYTYGFGGQFKANLIGYYDRFDSPMLYTKVPTSLAALVGGKYDQRAVERYPAGNAQLIFRTGPVIVAGETYAKRELEFESNQFAYNVFAGLLLWEKNLFLAGDFGAFIAGNLDNPPADLADAGADVKKQRDEQQARGALHFYFYENVGVLTAFYRWRDVKSSRDQKDGYKESEGRIVAQYRF